MKQKKGFTLIELLVVIAIIAVLVAFAIANFVGARSRARDIKKKSELEQVKNALRMFYNDYNNYPGPTSASTNDISGCGSVVPPATVPNLSCASACVTSGVGQPLAYQFATGANCAGTVYMKLLPMPVASGGYAWHYQQTANGDNFCLWASLENKSDSEIVNSQLKCSTVCGGVGYTTTTDYVLCAD